jgi:hypothetical protein
LFAGGIVGRWDVLALKVSVCSWNTRVEVFVAGGIVGRWGILTNTRVGVVCRRDCREVGASDFHG